MDLALRGLLPGKAVKSTIRRTITKRSLELIDRKINMKTEFEFYDSKEEIVQDRDSFVSIIPVGISNKKDLLNALYTSLQLPAYFGSNWDALDECIRDFHWLKQKKIIMIHGDLPLSLESERELYLDSLHLALHFWKDHEKHTVSVYFPRVYREEIERLLAHYQQEHPWIA